MYGQTGGRGPPAASCEVPLSGSLNSPSKPSATVELEHRLLCNTVRREQPLRDCVAGSAMSRFPFEDRSALADLPPAVQQRLRPHAQAPWQADLGLAGRALGLGPQLPPRRHLRDTAAEGRQAVQQSSGSSLGGAEGEATCCQPYCTQVITQPQNICALQLLKRVQQLKAADDRAAWLQTPHQGHKRFYCSLKETMRHIARAKLLVMAPDICQFQGSTTKALPLVDQVLEAAGSEGVPVVFALSRRGIGQVFGPNKCVSVVAVVDVQGCEAELLPLLELAHQGHRMFHAQQGCAYRLIG